MTTNIDLSHLTNEQLVLLRHSRKQSRDSTQSLLDLTQKLNAAGSLSTSPVLPEVESLLRMDPGSQMENPTDFRRRLMIDARGTIKSLEDALDPWQRADYEALDAGWRRLLTGEGDGKLRAYLERPRGHSKTMDIAVQIIYALTNSHKTIHGIAAATDGETAGFIRDAIDLLIRQNEWLRASVDLQKKEVINQTTGSWIRMITSDADSTFGHTPDFIICDELTHWKKRDLWDAIFSALPKKVCLMLVIANAGVGQGTSWQWQVREMARKSDRWHFSRLDGPVASWQSEEDIAEQSEGLPPKAVQRLWYNVWSVESGDCIELDDIRACTVHETGILRFLPQYEPFVAGLDLAVNRHHSALVVLGVHSATGKVRMAECQWWDPKKSPTGKIDLDKVLEAIRDARRRYRLFKISIDPSQAQYIAQLLEADAIKDPTAAMRIELVPQVGKHLHAMATSMVSAFRNHLIELHPDKALETDLLKLSIVEKQSGFHLVAPEDENGHADRAIAMALALPGALEMAKELNLRPIKPPEPPPRNGRDQERW